MHHTLFSGQTIQSIRIISSCSRKKFKTSLPFHYFILGKLKKLFPSFHRRKFENKSSIFTSFFFGRKSVPPLMAIINGKFSLLHLRLLVFAHIHIHTHTLTSHTHVMSHQVKLGHVKGQVNHNIYESIGKFIFAGLIYSPCSGTSGPFTTSPRPGTSGPSTAHV